MRMQTAAALLAVLLSCVALWPAIVSQGQFNTADLSPRLQAWRSKGQYYLHHRYLQFAVFSTV